MLQQLRAACVVLVGLTVLTGAIYPAIITAIGQLVFPGQARGSLLLDGNRPIGSALIGQSFSQPEYFWGRLSATAPVPYNAAASSGSNFGPLHPALEQAVHQRIAALRAYATPSTNVPIDLVTASGSGLDPHISPAAAEFQVPRIAELRKISADAVRVLVQRHTEPRQFGFLGEPRVNVLQLNRALDQGPSTE